MQYEIIQLKPFGLLIKATRDKLSLQLFSQQQIQQWLRKHHLLVWRGFEEFSKAEMVAYTKQLGPLLEWDFGAVMEMQVRDEANNYLFTNGKVPFHFDGAFHQEPLALFFHCIEAPLPDIGGETLFSNTEMIIAQSSPGEQASWQKTLLSMETEKKAHYGGFISCPLWQHHPDSYAPILRFAEPVDGVLNPVRVWVDRGDDDVIPALSQRLYDPQVCYTHTWHKNDYVLADNFSLLHARKAFAEFSPRHLRRIQLKEFHHG